MDFIIAHKIGFAIAAVLACIALAVILVMTSGPATSGTGGSGGTTPVPTTTASGTTPVVPTSSSGTTPVVPTTTSSAAVAPPGCPADVKIQATAENIRLYLGFLSPTRIPGKIGTARVPNRLMVSCDRDPLYDPASDMSNVDGTPCFIYLPGCFSRTGMYPMTAAAGPMFGQVASCFHEPGYAADIWEPISGGLGIECPPGHVSSHIDTSGHACEDYTPCKVEVPALPSP